MTRPKGYKAIALLGIMWNSMSLAILYPLYIYVEYTNPEKIPILRFMLIFSCFISIPLTSALLAGAIGLLLKQYWARSLCLWALSAELIFGVCYQIVDTAIRISNWDDSTIYMLMTIPLYILLWITEAAVILYLKSDGVKNYLNNYRKIANA